MAKKKLVLCSSEVNKDAIRREVIDGAEHIIVGSYTLPDNVVMNGGLYPAEEIEKSYKQLERTLAPVEHPKKEGNFVSANDPYAIHNFHAGAYNANVKREGNRIYLEKMINVQEAQKTDRGKRLLDRIKEIENNAKARPIHTSTGLFLEIEPTEGVQTNEQGQEYNWVARNMIFDHDAILLDTIGAATPDDGVGMAINELGDKVSVEKVDITVKPAESSAPQTSAQSVKEQLEAQLESLVTQSWLSIVDLIDDQCIFQTEKGYFQVQYRVDDGTATIVGIPIRTERHVTYSPKVNKDEGDAMKELMLKALADAGITVNSEISDEELMAKYKEALQVNDSSNSDDDGATGDDIATIVANSVSAAIKPLQEEMSGLKAQINADAVREVEQLAKLVANSEKYPGMDEETCKTLPVAKLREMAANCGKGYGLPLNGNQDSGSDGYQETDIPE